MKLNAKKMAAMMLAGTLAITGFAVSNKPTNANAVASYKYGVSYYVQGTDGSYHLAKTNYATAPSGATRVAGQLKVSDKYYEAEHVSGRCTKTVINRSGIMMKRYYNRKKTVVMPVSNVSSKKSNIDDLTYTLCDAKTDEVLATSCLITGNGYDKELYASFRNVTTDNECYIVESSVPVGYEKSDTKIKVSTGMIRNNPNVKVSNHVVQKVYGGVKIKVMKKNGKTLVPYSYKSVDFYQEKTAGHTQKKTNADGTITYNEWIGGDLMIQVRNPKTGEYETVHVSEKDMHNKTKDLTGSPIVIVES